MHAAPAISHILGGEQLVKIVQSYGNSYVIDKTEKSEHVKGNKFTTKCKNNETLQKIARCLIEKPTVTCKQLREIAGVKDRNIKYVLKKIRDQVNSGQILPCLSEKEMDQLTEALAIRGDRRGKVQSQLKSKAASMITAGQSIDQVMNIMGLDEKKFTKLINDNTRKEMAQKMFKKGNKIPFIADHLRISKSKTQNMISNNESLMVDMGKSLADGNKSMDTLINQTGFDKKYLLRALKKAGYPINKIAEKVASKYKEPYLNIAQRLGMKEKELLKLLNVRKGTCGRTCRTKATDTAFAGKKRSMIKPSKPKANYPKRPATISPEGLVEWNLQHYNPKTGKLEITDCAIPSDLPKRLPRKKIMLMPAASGGSRQLAAPAPSKSECSVRGRQRIGIMQLT
jgi:hypothetical protein